MSDPYLSLAVLSCIRVEERRADKTGIIGRLKPKNPSERDIRVVRRALREVLNEVAALELLLTATASEERQLKDCLESLDTMIR